jgi:hypothetical protein
MESWYCEECQARINEEDAEDNELRGNDYERANSNPEIISPRLSSALN